MSLFEPPRAGSRPAPPGGSQKTWGGPASSLEPPRAGSRPAPPGGSQKTWGGPASSLEPPRAGSRPAPPGGSQKTWGGPASSGPAAGAGRRRALRAAGAGAVAAGLAGCGFQLRQPPRLAFDAIALVGFAPRSPLAEELRRELARQVQLLDDPARAPVRLQALLDVRERSVVASTAASQVRELRLRLKFHFRADSPDGRTLIPPAELLLQRDLSYQESAALAKQHEEAELFRAMQSDVVAQVMRRLAALKV